MDSLTQIAIGIATAELCLGKQLKNKTFVYGAILGTFPDLDIWFGKLFDPITAVALHRGFSHSLVFYLIMSIFFGSIIYKLEKGKVKIVDAINASFLILVTHSIMDAFTTWGTQIFWPLPYKIAFKSIFVVDFFYTIPWLICLFLVFKSNDILIRKKWLKTGFYITTLYLLMGVGIKFYVLNKFEDSLKNSSINYSEIMVKPTFSNLILWNANVLTNNSILIADYSLFDKNPIKFKTYSRNLHLENNLKNVPDFIKLKHISEGWYALQVKNNQLHFNDVRFGLLNDNELNPDFVFSYQFVIQGDSFLAEEVVKKRADGKKHLMKIIQRVFGQN